MEEGGKRGEKENDRGGGYGRRTRFKKTMDILKAEGRQVRKWHYTIDGSM